MLFLSVRRFFDYACLGHFHSAGALDRVIGELILNGSAVGGNEFSIGALFTSNQRRQLMFGVHPEKGRTWQFALDLSRAHGKVRYVWYPGDHDYPPHVRKEAVEWFKRWLR